MAGVHQGFLRLLIGKTVDAIDTDICSLSLELLSASHIIFKYSLETFPRYLRLNIERLLML
jgi:hypothetical protein